MLYVLKEQLRNDSAPAYMTLRPTKGISLWGPHIEDALVLTMEEWNDALAPYFLMPPTRTLEIAPLPKLMIGATYEVDRP